MTAPPALDPRLRIFFTIAATFVFLTVRHHLILAAVALTLAAAGLLHPGLGFRMLRRRLLTVNLFSGMLLLLLPWSIPGEPLAQWGLLAFSQEGLLDALRIALKANVVVLVATLFLTPLEPMVLGQAVSQLGAPRRLVQLYFLTLRYVRVLEDEYQRLRRAMLIRGFRARANLHTVRAFGYLVGMLLIRALDRAERIWQAMLCRGFTGSFPRMHPLRIRAADLAIAASLMAALAAVWGADRAVPPW